MPETRPPLGHSVFLDSLFLFFSFLFSRHSQLLVSVLLLRSAALHRVLNAVGAARDECTLHGRVARRNVVFFMRGTLRVLYNL